MSIMRTFISTTVGVVVLVGLPVLSLSYENNAEEELERKLYPPSHPINRARDLYEDRRKQNNIKREQNNLVLDDWERALASTRARLMSTYPNMDISLDCLPTWQLCRQDNACWCPSR